MKQNKRMRLGAVVCSLLIASAVAGYAQGETANAQPGMAQPPQMSAEMQTAMETYNQALQTAMQGLAEAGILTQAELDAWTAQPPQGQGTLRRARGQGAPEGMQPPPQQAPEGNRGRESGNLVRRGARWRELMTQEKIDALTAEQKAVWAEVEKQLESAETALDELMQKLRPANQGQMQ